MTVTFFVNGRNGECKSCGYKMQIPANEGKGGKGKNAQTVVRILYLMIHAVIMGLVINKATAIYMKSSGI